MKSKLGNKPRWQYLVGASIVGAIVTVSGVAVAVTSLDSLSDGSGGGGSYGQVFNCDNATQVITGYHPGGVAATRGTVCILDATVAGGVAVTANVTLIIEDSTISGGIAAAGLSGLEVCGSEIDCALSVTGSHGFVLIGDPDNGCASNVLASVTASSNHNGLVIVDNTVHGTLLATNNSGAGPLPGQTGPVVAGNHH